MIALLTSSAFWSALLPILGALVAFYFQYLSDRAQKRRAEEERLRDGTARDQAQLESARVKSAEENRGIDKQNERADEFFNSTPGTK